MSGTNWLDLSLSSNRHIRTYVQGFVDISGGNLIVRNNNLFVYGGDSSLNGRLLVSGDSSLNGNLTIGSTLYPTGGINLQNNLNMGGLINQSGTTVQGGVIYQPIVTSDVSAIINASNMYVNNMIQSGSKFIIGNANTSVVIGVSGVSGVINVGSSSSTIVVVVFFFFLTTGVSEDVDEELSGVIGGDEGVSSNFLLLVEDEVK
jgi:hypothetical protein